MDTTEHVRPTNYYTKVKPTRLKIQNQRGWNGDHSIYVNVTGVRKRLNPVINYCHGKD